MRFLTSYGAIIVAAAFTGSALGQSGSDPVAQMIVDGQTYTLPTALIPGTDRFMLVPTTITGAGFNLEVQNGTLDPDPTIAWGISVTDFGAPSAFVISFTQPIVPTASPTNVFGSIVGGLTDFTGDGASITPVGGPLMMVNDVSSDGGGTWTNMGVNVGPVQVYAGPPGALHNYGSFFTPTIAGPAGGPWDTMRSTLSFTLSGNGDIAVLTGFASIETVPTPGAAALFAIGGLLTTRRRRA